MSIPHSLGQNADAWPFSPSPLGGLSAGCAGAETDALRAAAITAAAIPEGRAATGPRPPAQPSLPPEIATLSAGDAPFAVRPIPHQAGLRLLPLESFAWGSRNPQVQPRTRGDWTLIWVTGGGLALDYPRRRMTLRAGTVHFIPAGTAFAALPLPGTSGHVLLIASDLARAARPEFPSTSVTGMIGDGAAALLAGLRDMAEEARAERPGSHQALASHLSLLSVRLSRLSPPRRLAGDDPARPADLPLIRRFLDLAATELTRGRTIADLAETLGTTTAALDRACLKAHGKRAIQMIHDLRYQRAVDTLRHSRKTTAEIARELGYPSHANFVRSVVARSGRLPENLRRP